MSDYTFIRISDDNYHYIKTLYKRSFHFDVPLQYIVKKYDTSEFGLKNTGFFAIDENNTPGAYYGVFPMTLLYEGKEYLIAQSGDTMTDPDHRNKGLFTKLAKETYQFVKNNKVKFVFGFPNQNSYPGFKNKLEWIFFGSLQEFKVTTGGLPMCELFSMNTFFKRIYHSVFKFKLRPYIVEPTTEIADSFNNKYAKGAIKKDVHFFKYKKYEDCHLIRFGDFNFFVKAGSHLIVGDVEHFSSSRLDEFLLALHKLSKKVYCRSVIFMMSKNHWLYPLLSEKFSSKEGAPVGFLKFDEDFDFENISFTLADSDTF